MTQRAPPPEAPFPGSALGRGLRSGGEARKPPRNHVHWLGPGRGDGRTWVQVASRHFCLFTVTCGSSLDKAVRCSDRPGPRRSLRGRSSRNTNTHDLSRRLPTAKGAERPSRHLDPLSRGGLWAPGPWESSPGGARDPGMGRRPPEPPGPPPARTGPSSGRRACHQAWSPRGGWQQGQMGTMDGEQK